MLKKKKEVISETKPNYYSMPLGSIIPSGYLKDEIDKFITNRIIKTNTSWKSLENNYLIGGKSDFGHLVLEYIENLVVLSYEANNSALKEKVKPWIDGILSTQRQNGDILKEGKTDYIDKIYAMCVLTAYYDATLDKRIPDFIYKFAKYQFNEIDMLPPHAYTMTALCNEYAVLNYFYEETDKEFYLELKNKLQRFNYTYEEYFDSLAFQNETKSYLSKSTILFKSNFIKKQKIVEDLSSADKVMSENRDKSLKKYILSRGPVCALNLKVKLEEGKHSNNDLSLKTREFIKNLYLNNGLVNGCFSSTAHIDGKEFDSATDLETAVKTLESMLTLEELSTDSLYSNLADDIFYNVLPSMYLNNYTLVQGIGGPNQVGLETTDYYTVNKKSNNYSDDLSNEEIVYSSKLFTKFIGSLCYETDDGLAFHHYAPCSIQCSEDEANLRILETTDYPFKNKVNFDVVSVDRPIELIVRFVVPRYTTITVFVNGDKITTGENGVIKIKKTFVRGDRISLEINNNLKAIFNDDGSLSFRMGGLLLVNPLNSNVSFTKKGISTEIREDFRKAPIIKDNKLLVKSISRRENMDSPFDYNRPMVTVKLQADVVTNWSKSATNYSSIPKVAQFSNSSDLITLVPYGNSINRISQFPYKVTKTVNK